MASQTLLLVLVATLLLSHSFGERSEHRRQKRGIAKMMMHMMWDPVRLIRYWYAYDVTKEIAKSWRKIVPTMVLHPYLGDAPGVAKYMNPTYKLTSADKKQTGQFKYPDGYTEKKQWIDQAKAGFISPGTVNPSQDAYRHVLEPIKNGHGGTVVQVGSSSPTAQVSDDYLVAYQEQLVPDQGNYGSPLFQVANGYVLNHQNDHGALKNPEIRYGDRLPIGSSIVLESAPSSINSIPIVFGPSMSHHMDVSSDTSYSVVESKDAHHVYLKPIMHHDFKRDNRGRLPPHVLITDDGGKIIEPMKSEINNGDEADVAYKAIPPPSIQVVPSNINEVKAKLLLSDTDHAIVDHSSFEKKYYDYKLHQQRPVDHQEIHIILHPVHVTEGLKEKRFNFIPYNVNANATSIFSNEQHTQGSDEPQKNQSVQQSQANNDLILNTSNTATEMTVVDDNDTKQTSRVTWILKTGKDCTSTKGIAEDSTSTKGIAEDSTSTKGIAEDGGESSDRTNVSKVSEDTKDASAQHPLRLKGNKIDLNQLREDLKHGTPVLIPFDKTVNLPNDSEQNYRSFNTSHPYSPAKDSKEELVIFPQDMERDNTASLVSNEEYASNTTQRLLLFLAKKHSSKH